MTGNAPFPPRGTKEEIEEGTSFSPKFDADGLITAVTTDAKTGELLMVAWMNAEALARTVETGEAWYWSRSRGELWHKGGTSGQIQTVIELRTDCDQDTVWLKVDVAGDGGCCHAGYRSCFYRRVPKGEPAKLEHTGAEKLPHSHG
ncbi:MAG: phosphoribosyl-AMP cyclohydrolase [Alphaproteobacteria bacterium HGW-Alphaproteobacteria-3]|nr:MAG: phosphoribosyl-AMP cyclohydrolase [Alphaproteobacteria bacterium HGW-Alphaproteobacteria-3]